MGATSNTQHILKILHKEESEGFVKVADQCQSAAVKMFENAAKEEKSGPPTYLRTALLLA